MTGGNMSIYKHEYIYSCSRHFSKILDHSYPVSLLQYSYGLTWCFLWLMQILSSQSDLELCCCPNRAIFANKLHYMHYCLHLHAIKDKK